MMHILDERNLLVRSNGGSIRAVIRLTSGKCLGFACDFGWARQRSDQSGR